MRASRGTTSSTLSRAQKAMSSREACVLGILGGAQPLFRARERPGEADCRFGGIGAFAAQQLDEPARAVGIVDGEASLEARADDLDVPACAPPRPPPPG